MFGQGGNPISCVLSACLLCGLEADEAVEIGMGGGRGTASGGTGCAANMFMLATRMVAGGGIIVFICALSPFEVPDLSGTGGGGTVSVAGTG